MPPQAKYAGLLLAHDATDADAETIEFLAGEATTAGATPIVVVLPPSVQAPSGARVVRVKHGGSRGSALRFGMAQLTNTSARAVMILPLRGARRSLVALLALLDGAERSDDALVAFRDAPLDDSPVIVPRDAWLELVTLGDDGLGAVAARRGMVRIDPSHP